MSKLFGFYILWIRVVLFTCFCFVWIILWFMLFTNLGCLYGLCYIMLWNLDFGFVDVLYYLFTEV